MAWLLLILSGLFKPTIIVPPNIIKVYLRHLTLNQHLIMVCGNSFFCGDIRSYNPLGSAVSPNTPYPKHTSPGRVFTSYQNIILFDEVRFAFRLEIDF